MRLCSSGSGGKNTGGRGAGEGEDGEVTFFGCARVPSCSARGEGPSSPAAQPRPLVKAGERVGCQHAWCAPRAPTAAKACRAATAPPLRQQRLPYRGVLPPALLPQLCRTSHSLRAPERLCMPASQGAAAHGPASAGGACVGCVTASEWSDLCEWGSSCAQGTSAIIPPPRPAASRQPPPTRSGAARVRCIAMPTSESWKSWVLILAACGGPAKPGDGPPRGARRQAAMVAPQVSNPAPSAQCVPRSAPAVRSAKSSATVTSLRPPQRARITAMHDHRHAQGAALPRSRRPSPAPEPRPCRHPRSTRSAVEDLGVDSAPHGCARQRCSMRTASITAQGRARPRPELASAVCAAV
eukprot:gene782-biopygen6165